MEGSHGDISIASHVLTVLKPLETSTLAVGVSNLTALFYERHAFMFH